jgi:sensor histidine kinase YesM
MHAFIQLITRHPWTKHIVFWSALFMSFILFGLHERESWWLVLIEEAIHVGIYAGIVYVNFHVLIPSFLSKKKIISYAAFLLLFLVLLTPIVTALLFGIYSGFDRHDLAEKLDQRIVFASFAMVAFLSTLFQILNEWLMHERDRRVLEQQKAQTELRFLKSQINPHFLFNTLNNLYALTLKKSDLAPEIVLKLSDMMRYMLYECNEKTVPLSKEIRYIKNYLSLEEIRQGKEVEIQFEVEGDINDQLIAPLLFIPFIENCFKHGVNRQLSNAYVHLKISIDDTTVIMELKNSKPDIIPGLYNKKPGGIGQNNVKHQLELLYPKKHKLTIEESPSFYFVTLNLNLV